MFNLTADLGGDTTSVKILVCPDYVAGTYYVMIDHKSAMKLANPQEARQVDSGTPKGTTTAHRRGSALEHHAGTW